ncbi:polynucleotide kinase-phosphatase [Pararhizobium sp. BT-229]|uniref:polynucleotide kinase-phosphatase n=1 Tax=Pararhizobium sp. BT-229 TaxID=2986923 RepID=UPI0021F7E77B|nr:polynucleotide kinase-phosphatase [Pararhizobium sp. BT-229]MCV9964948.1 polynucleotide kinase-phosphatase [Pararhizobium sp. BT-229]
MTEITLNELGLVLLVGPTGSGKTTFGARLFDANECVSLDACRALVSGDPEDQSATRDASDVAERIIEARLRRRLLTVVDATNVRHEDRQRWIAAAERTHSLVSAIVLDPGMSFCHKHARKREGTRYNPKAVEQHHTLLFRDKRKLGKAFGIRNAVWLSSAEEIEAASIVRRRSFNDLRDVTGPFDVIGDIHGMTEELEALLAKLGWSLSWSGEGEERRAALSHPDGRKLVFVGDAVDRGPRSLDALRIMRSAVESGVGYAVASNHDARISRWLRGQAVSEGGGIETTQAEFEGLSEAFRVSMGEFIDGLPAHYVFDGGALAVAHAGIEEGMILGASKAMREFAVYGPKTPPDATGKSERVDWAKGYRGKTAVVYGHVACDEAVWLNNTICIDTAAVYGVALTALRWPEKELVSVAASRAYAELDKPLFSRKDNRGFLELSHADVTGKKHIETSLAPRVTVEADQMAAAMETLSRFTIDPRLLVYLPPTMSPVESSKRPGILEHPEQAFEYYRNVGLDEVVVETKHMGSRAHILVCRDADAARARFHTEDDHVGHIWTRNGNAFFKDDDRRQVLRRISSAAVPLFDELGTDWLLLDAEIMPWNTKAATLIRDQYAPSGKAAMIGAGLAWDAFRRFASRGIDPVFEESRRFKLRQRNADRFDKVWRGYSWETPTLDDVRIAPFHVLASEGRVHSNERHSQHMRWIDKLLGRDPIFTSTDFAEVSLHSPAALEAVVDKWMDDTARGAEGIVVKPFVFSIMGERGLVQPALKVRGIDYLRIIYGVDYDMPENIERLRERATKSKRARAVKEHALGVEALDRLVAREPLRRVHECVAAIIGLESDPSDPRL